MKPAVEVSITSWKKNVVKPGQEYGRVLLMPGTGYNCDRPLLYWSAQALVEAGWRIDRMNVRNASDDLSTVIPVLNQAIDGWVAAARESGAGKAGDSGDGVAADDSRGDLGCILDIKRAAYIKARRDFIAIFSTLALSVAVIGDGDGAAGEGGIAADLDGRIGSSGAFRTSQ